MNQTSLTSLSVLSLLAACSTENPDSTAEAPSGQARAKSTADLCAEQAACPDPSAAPGDVDGDGSVGRRDVRALRNRLTGAAAVVCAASADVDGDGTLGREDLRTLRAFLLDPASASLIGTTCEPADTGSLDTGGPGDTGGTTPAEANYYVSPDGSDSNPGTLDAPFATVEKLSSVMRPGELAYLRGGTYTSKKGNGAGVHFAFQDLVGTPTEPITIETYPGETAVFDLSAVQPTAAYPYAMWLVDSDYVHLKGKMVVKNLKQIADGSGISRGFDLERSTHCTVENIDIYNMGGTGFTLSNADDNLIKNVDSHHNGDGLTVNDDGSSDSWDNADGFSSTGGDTSTGNVFDGCRAWLNSDDGWDFFDWAGDSVTIQNSWSFWEGVRPWGPTAMSFTSESGMTPGDPSVFFGTSASQRSYQSSGGGGEGFKCGGGSQPGRPTTLTKHYLRDVAFENIGTGYAGNSVAAYSQRYEYKNSVAYHNGNDGFSLGVGWSTGIAHTMVNDWAWKNNQLTSGADWVYDGLDDNIANNVWPTVYGGVNYGNIYSLVGIDSSDFLGLSSAGADGPRGPDGDLPDLDFLKLSPTSDFVDAGIEDGLSYNGSAPDLGAFERP